MSKIRSSAKGEECQIQIHPYCNGNPETTVLCHAPSEDKCMGKKSPDFWAAYGCSTCHDIVDFRMSTHLTRGQIFACLMRGVFRTQKILIQKGLMNV